MPPPVQIIHYRIFKDWCATCQKWHEAPVDVQCEVLEQGRLGVRLVNLIALLNTVMRLPVQQIRLLLLTFHEMEVSTGDLSEVLHRLVAHAQPALDHLKIMLHASPAVRADETGWREDGTNGYV